MKASRLHLSILFFITFAAFGGIGNFLSLYYLDRGMSVQQVGLLVSVPAAMSLLAAPLWAGIADWFHLHKYILPIVMLLSLPVALVFPKFENFGQLMLGILFFSGCYSTFLPLLDNTVLVNLGTQKTHYGHIRLWGSIGVGLMALVTGWLVEQFNLKIIFAIYSFFITLAAVSALLVPKPPKIKIESYWKRAGQFLRDSRWKKFLFACLLSGLSHLFLAYYLFIFIKGLGAKDTFIGFAIMLSAATNIIIYFIMPRLLQHWSVLRLMLLSNILMIVRMLIAIFIHTPEMSIIVVLLDGPTWATMWSAGVHYASDIAPHGLGASAQALYNGIFTGLGGIISASLGGVIYAHFGAPVLFSISAVFALLCVLMLFSLDHEHESFNRTKIDTAYK